MVETEKSWSRFGRDTRAKNEPIELLAFLRYKFFDSRLLQNPYCTQCGCTKVRLIRVGDAWRRGRLRLVSIVECSRCGNRFSDPKMEAE
jgi:hypothetical protein